MEENLQFQKAELFRDKVVYTDVEGMYLCISDGSMTCGNLQEPNANCANLISAQEYYGTSTSRIGRIIASGDSMIGVGIFDGDVLVIDKSQIVQTGSTIVAKYQGAMTVKTYYKDTKTDEIFLMPANDAYAPIHIENLAEFAIEGVVTKNLHSQRVRRAADLQEQLDRDSNNMRLEKIMRRTAEEGYMAADYRWTKKASQEFKAVWIDTVCTELKIKEKWEWASTKWGLPDLRRYLTRVYESTRFDEIDSAMKTIMR